jgi:hypothetical protein
MATIIRIEKQPSCAPCQSPVKRRAGGDSNPATTVGMLHKYVGLPSEQLEMPNDRDLERDPDLDPRPSTPTSTLDLDPAPRPRPRPRPSTYGTYFPL